MSDIIYYKNGEETFRISPPTVGTKTPKNKLEVKKMTEIEKVKAEIKMLQSKLGFLEELEKTKSPVEEAFKRVYGTYPSSYDKSVFWTESDEDTWIAFQQGYNASKVDYKVGEYQPSPQTPEQVADGLRDAMRQAKEEGVFDEPTKPMNEVVDRMVKEWEENPPEFLKFELGKTLEALITRWWCDVFTTHEDWDMETAIDDLCDRVELWLPKSQSASGSQSLGVEDMVEGFNDCLKKIKSKLRNKK
jgi:hypothetical protein